MSDTVQKYLNNGHFYELE